MNIDFITREPTNVDRIEKLVAIEKYFRFVEGHEIPPNAPLYLPLKKRFKLITSQRHYMSKTTLFSIVEE